MIVAAEELVYLEYCTERLRLRDLCEEDVEVIVAQFAEREAQPFILRWQRDPSFNSSYLRTAAEYAGRSDRIGFQFAVECLKSRELIGICGITRAWKGSTDSRIGWHFGKKYSGLGYATEAATATLRFAFEEREVSRVRGDCFKSNLAARRIFEKLGMTRSRFGFLTEWVLPFQYKEPRMILRYVASARCVNA